MAFKTVLLFFVFTICMCAAQSQPLQKRLLTAVTKLSSDTQVAHSMVSLCVADTDGHIVFNLNNEVGMAPASNMKVFTSIAGFDLLGADYTFKTEIGFTGKIADSVLQGDVLIVGNGDPSTGSWRFGETKAESFVKKIITILRSKGIGKINGELVFDGSRFSDNPLPGGWSWDDMGNYYGAGTWGLNWHENQYDLQLQPGKKEGDSIRILQSDPQLPYTTFINKLTTGKPGSGDNSYIFLPPNSNIGIIEGTLPADDVFTISGSLPEPYTAMYNAIKEGFRDNNFEHDGGFQTSAGYALQNKRVPHFDSLAGVICSPSFDSLNYYFMKKSINLYGEDFIKTMALQKDGMGSTEKGVELLKSFWKEKGIAESAFNIKDGSGLSAQTRVTTDALVKALVYARSKNWFPQFYNALPVVNNMHMKTGTIGGVKAFSGYQKAANGKEYVFSIIVNNYNGATESLINKMYAVLNELKK